MRITNLRTTIVHVSERTNWVFVHVDTNEGLSGIGEATIGGKEPQVLQHLEEMKSALVGRNPADMEALCPPDPSWGLPEAAARSAVEQALWDLNGQALGVPVWRLLGGACRESVPVYANINRGTLDRSPDGFAAAAKRAVAQGFRTIKCAPFDGVTPGGLATPEGRSKLATALERIFRVREAVGPEIQLKVDCHWRLDLPTAVRVARELEPVRLTWLEDPMPHGDLRSWAELKEQIDLPIAGGELQTGLAGTMNLLNPRVVDVICPDVKYIGGLGPSKHVAAAAEVYGIQVAPHNPSGPVSTIASLHLSAAIRNFAVLEYAVGECDWRRDLVGGAETFVNGEMLLPTTPGLGVRLNQELAAAHPYQPIVPMRERSDVDIH